MSRLLSAVKITLQDAGDDALVTEDTTLGLYNNKSDLFSNAAADQKDVIVPVGEGVNFSINDVVNINDTNNSEVNLIVSIASDTLTMKNNLKNTYTTANSAKVNRNSEFRFSEAVLSGTTDPWTTGILKSHSSTGMNSDFSRGGNLPKVKDFGVVIKSVDDSNNPFHVFLNNQNIEINGLKVDLLEFELDNSDVVINADGDIISSGAINDIDHNEIDYTIQTETTYYKRLTNLGTKISSDSPIFPNAEGNVIGKIVPVTFGELGSNKEDGTLGNNFGLYRRTGNKTTKFISPWGEKIFPVVAGQQGFQGVAAPGPGAGTSVITVTTTGNFRKDAQLIIYNTATGDNEIQTILSITATTITIVGTFTFGYPVGTSFVKSPLDRQYLLSFGDISQGIFFTASSEADLNKLAPDGLVNQFLQVIEGKSSGQARKITSIKIPDITTANILVTVSTFFEERLLGNPTADVTDQSWTQIIDIERIYNADIFPLENFIDNAGTVITENLETYIFDSDLISYRRLPQSALITGTTQNKEKIEIDTEFFNSNADDVVDFLILPVKDPKPLTDANSAVWDFLPLGDVPSQQAKVTDGLYRALAAGFTFSFPDPATSKMIDKDSTTFFSVKFKGTVNPSNGNFILEFKFPDFPENFEFDQVFVGIKATYDSPSFGINLHTFEFKTRRFIGPATDIVSLLSISNVPYQLYNIKDDYFTDTVDTENVFFYIKKEIDILAFPDVSNIPFNNIPNTPINFGLFGFENYEITNIETKDLYESINKGAIGFGVALVLNEEIEIKFFEVALIFKKTQSIKSEIFLPIRGRTYKDSNFAARYLKASTDMIENPIAIAEHILRLQNWSETSLPPSVEDDLASNASATDTTITMTDASIFRIGDLIKVIDNDNEEQGTVADGLIIIDINLTTNIITLNIGLTNSYDITKDARVIALREWGKEYADNPLLSIGTDQGQFDNASLTALKLGTKSARQILSENNAQSDQLLLSLCRNFDLGIIQTIDGKEGIVSLGSPPNPTITIELKDIVGSIGDLREPEPQYMHAEPFIRYRKNSATGSFEKEIRVSHISESIFNPEYVQGMSGTPAEELWLKCRAIFLRTRQINVPSSEMTDMDWIVDDTDAEDRIERWVDWMIKKRISFAVHYDLEIGVEKIRKLFSGYVFNLKLPFHTGNVVIRCIIEAITNNKENNITNLDVVLLDEQTEGIDIQDVFTGVTDFQDVFTGATDFQNVT